MLPAAPAISASTLPLPCWSEAERAGVKNFVYTSSIAALGKNFISWYDIACMAKEMPPESKSQIIASDEEGHHALYGVGKMERVFGLSFDSGEDLKDHIAWNPERAKAAKEGKEVHNVLHVW